MDKQDGIPDVAADLCARCGYRRDAHGIIQYTAVPTSPKPSETVLICPSGTFLSQADANAQLQALADET